MIDQLDFQTENGQSEPVSLPSQGNGESLNELFGNSMPRLFRVADCVLHNCHDSEDALQDGLLSALRHIDQFQGNSQFSTWLFSIVRNSALAKLRKQRAHLIVSIEDQPSEERVRDERAGSPRRSRAGSGTGVRPGRAVLPFARTLENLPANYRAIVWLCDFEGFSGKEAAQRLGLSVSALKAQHHRARLAIRRSMSIHIMRRDG